MATDFDSLLAERTKNGAASVHGVMIKCIDKQGNELYSKIAGHDSVAADAAPLSADAVLKLGSATKLFTSIALLQCIDKGLLGLDEPLAQRVLPELHRKPILERAEGSESTTTTTTTTTTRPSTTDITARHLLAHTSGLGYWFTHPLLLKWRTAGEGKDSSRLTARMDYPLIFEPGQGWLYGCSLDWAGVAVSRLHGDVSLEEYMVENIWKRLGRVAPFPTFHISRHPEYERRAMQSAERTPDGGLTHADGMAYCANLADDEGGAGLSATMGDCLAVLQDLIADAPRLLTRATVAAMFAPQLPPDSPGIPMLLQLRPAWDIVAGPVPGDEVNHGLGGLLVLGEAPDIAQPGGLLCWGGSPNIVWFVCRERGVAGFFGTQVSPFGDAGVKELVNAWKKDFWGGMQHGHGVSEGSM